MVKWIKTKTKPREKKHGSSVVSTRITLSYCRLDFPFNRSASETNKTNHCYRCRPLRYRESKSLWSCVCGMNKWKRMVELLLHCLYGWIWIVRTDFCVLACTISTYLSLFIYLRIYSFSYFVFYFLHMKLCIWFSMEIKLTLILRLPFPFRISNQIYNHTHTVVLD